MAVPRFRALWLAQAQSLAGDQLARVALSVLVFGRTGSAALTALVYGLTFVPAVLGGALLGGLADRMSRTGLMISCDLVRAALVAVMALPSVPLPVLCCLLVVVVVAGQPFLAAEIALLPSLLSGERFVVGSGLRMITTQTAQLAGFAGGGLAVALLGARGGLAVDAATFVLSALVIRVRVHTPERHAAREGVRRRPKLADARSAAGLVWSDRRLRALAALGWLAAFHIVPEALAAPYAAELGGGPRTVGLLMAAPPAGTVLGALAVLRLPARTRVRLLGPMALLSAVPLIACALRPGLALSLVLWTLLGVFSAYQVQAAASFVRLVPDERRGQVMGLVGSVLIAVQGVGVLAFGLVGERISAASTVAIAGAIGTVAAAGIAIALPRIRLTPAEPTPDASTPDTLVHDRSRSDV